MFLSSHEIIRSFYVKLVQQNFRLNYIAIMLIKPTIFDGIYPRYCVSCSHKLLSSEKCICLVCDMKIGRNDNLNDPKVYDLLYGRFHFENVYAMYNYQSDSVLSPLFSELKYKKNRDAGIFLGERLGVKLREWINSPEEVGIVPMPIHKKKKKKRGYNQSELIARGIRNKTNAGVQNCVSRIKHSVSQTKLDSAERVDNMENAFLALPLNPKIKQVWLVDDIITTGSTIINCAKEIKRVNPLIQINIATTAVTIQ